MSGPLVTTGITGTDWRASITPWGGIEPWPHVHDRYGQLAWYVAAEDRWHRPQHEPTVRQRRLDGTPVTETRVRVPNGDVVQTVYTVADGGGITIVEVHNESTRPVAVAFDRAALLTERAVAPVEVAGIELPASTIVLPLAHRATIRVGIAHRPGAGDRLPAGLPTAAQIVRGWLATTEAASRFVLPDAATDLADRVTAARCDIALGVMPADRDPAASAVALGESVRMGVDPSLVVEQLADVAQRLVATRGAAAWEVSAGFDAARRVMAAAGERRAVGDIDRIVSSLAAATTARRLPDTPPDGPLAIAWIESSFCSAGGDLLPTGIPAAWWGQSFEAHRVPAGPDTAVSLAVRWHGARPAVLWEQHGPPVELRAPLAAPGWRATSANGEALWPAPAG